jgi:hypothetical protein
MGEVRSLFYLVPPHPRGYYWDQFKILSEEINILVFSQYNLPLSHRDSGKVSEIGSSESQLFLLLNLVILIEGPSEGRCRENSHP